MTANFDWWKALEKDNYHLMQTIHEKNAHTGFLEHFSKSTCAKF